tara:strand:- start:1270 stop:1464 length:195 start_codon:yes stop_codon:yes gene_type:complete
MSYNIGQQVYCKESNRQATVVSINEETVTIQYKVSGEVVEVNQGQIAQLLLGQNKFEGQTFLQD